MTFPAFVLTERDGGVAGAVEQLDDDALPAGDVVVDVEWSSLNYKDGLILKGMARLVRTYPHVPGIDLAGTVATSTDPRFAPGDTVLCTGWRVGENRWGGYAAKASLLAEHVTPVPAGLTTRRAMALGTPGVTIALAIDALEGRGLRPGDGPVLVTGASGGVGSLAVHVLTRLGYEVHASTGKVDQHDWLRALGATEVVDRAELADPPAKPLLSERWAGCIDTVGGATLAHVLAELRSDAAVAACGNAAGNDVPASTIPFLLRGVAVFGINSVPVPADARPALWDRLATAVDPDVLDGLTSEAGLADLPRLADEILAGQVRGRVVVRSS
jgi:acrylyl-CoA reductase (NADPH)